jgi:glyoxylase-like metal-dependent hydrolase (beta-lactamase superfamily II)
MTVSHNASTAVVSLQFRILGEEIRDLGLHRLPKQAARSLPEDFGELVLEGSWLNQFDNVIVGHGISLLEWRSGGVKHPHDMPPSRFGPSPTFANSSEIPDGAFKEGVSPQKLNNYTVDRPLLPQLAAIGYTPANITYLALSHYHGDHVANASLFAGSTWIVQKADRDPILAPRAADSRVPDPKFFDGLAKSKTIVLNDEDHDVFGDGTVVIKSTPGHTPGHQALFLKLAKTGNIVLSGDLYHYPEEITYKKVPNFDTDKAQTAKSREMIEEFVKQNHAQLWIQHDYIAGTKRKIAPEFYD